MIRALQHSIIVSSMSLHTLELNLASIVTSALTGLQTVSDLNFNTQGLNLICASIVISALVIRHTVSGMNFNTQGLNLISASIVISALVIRHTVSSMNVHIGLKSFQCLCNYCDKY